MRTIPACLLVLTLMVQTDPCRGGAVDPLPSWKESTTKLAILNFVDAVTSSASKEFVPQAERIAVFDNDGTLWCEYPVYTQFLFGRDRAREQVARHPDWKSTEPYKSALGEDLDALAATGVKGLVQLLVGTNAGMTTEEFAATATDWLQRTRHPRFNRPFTECVYQPMVELLRLLQAKGFKTYIVSGGSVEFIRPWCEKAYGIPPEQVIGSTAELDFESSRTADGLVRGEHIAVLNDREEKAVSIQQIIGRRPILAIGNSDGDLPMLEYTAAGKGARFCGLIHHTDAEREYAYDKAARVGKLDRGLTMPRSNRWVVVDMATDWEVVFPAAKDAAQ